MSTTFDDDPPAAKGETFFAVRVDSAPLDAGAECAALMSASPSAAGGTAFFAGTVRDEARALTLEHYPAMTERALRGIAEAAAKRWPLLAVRVSHRVGRIATGETIVFAGVASAHRAEAFAACRYIADHLKTRAPFWKKEEGADGKVRWISSTKEDDLRAAEWG